MNQPTNNFAFFLVPGFSMVALSCAIDVLRAVNMELDQKLYQWVLISQDGSHVHSSSDIELQCQPLSSSEQSDTIAICGGLRSHLFKSEKVSNWLREEARKNKQIGALSDGAYIVADAGLFNHSRSTIHWKCQTAYREQHPDLDVRASILEIDRNRFSCAGGTASLDLALHYVSQQLGPDLASSIAENYLHDVIRIDGEVQQISRALSFANRSKDLSKVLQVMEATLETPLEIQAIADKTKIPHRQLDRLFKKHLNVSPSAYYRELRLVRASALLKQTSLSINEIAIACGFHTASHLSKFLKIRFGETPLKHRQTEINF